MSPACSPVCPGTGRTMLCILLLSGLCSCLYQYHLINEPKSWPQALEYCREKYTDLARADDIEAMKRLIAAAGSGYEGNVWIGLHDQPKSWRWSYKNGDMDFSRWKEGEPNNIIVGRICVGILAGDWLDYPCEIPFSFVCYNETNPLDLPATSIERYFFIDEKKTWTAAWLYCRTHHTNLASVRNESENNVIKQVVPGDRVVTIGLHRFIWSWWTDGAFSMFRYWAAGHPRSLTDHCAASAINATHLGKWVENHCTEKLPFMCQHDKTQLFNVKLTVLASTIDLNDPAVLEAILNLLNKKMKDKGITRDFKISWIKKPDQNIFHKEKEKADAVQPYL